MQKAHLGWASALWISERQAQSSGRITLLLPCSILASDCFFPARSSRVDAFAWLLARPAPTGLEGVGGSLPRVASGALRAELHPGLFSQHPYGMLLGGIDCLAAGSHADTEAGTLQLVRLPLVVRLPFGVRNVGVDDRALIRRAAADPSTSLRSASG